MRHVIAGTAGHIDHGKSALVRALTGTDPDRLKEEKLRGITIDLGFAHLDLGNVQVGFVDVPGHEKFVKNMLAGVGGIDFVIMVVAADESIMPQTREHFDICRLLGITAGIVVLTKTDLVEPDLIDVVHQEIQDLTEGSFLDGADIVPVSSKTGEGIEVLKEAIRRLALQSPERPSDRLLRLPIDRAFTVRGFGTVVTGTLTSGEVHKEQEVELLPGGLTARVRGIQVHGNACARAVAGQRTAVNLQGIELGQVERGMVLTVPHLFRPTQLVDVKLHLLPTAPRPLKNLVKVRFHQGTSEILARVALMKQDTLPPGESAFAQLRLDSATFCLHGDPFIIRQFSPTMTIGGGRVLNPHPAKYRAAAKNILADLQLLDQDSLEQKIVVFVDTHDNRVIDLGKLNSLLGLKESELDGLCRRLAAAGRIVLVPGPTPILVPPARVEELEQKTVAEVELYHRNNPLQKGVSREELRRKIYDELPLELYRFCLEDLAKKKKLSLLEENVALHGRAVTLSNTGEQLRNTIESLFRESAYLPPPLTELLGTVPGNPEEVRKIYFWMVKEKILVKISEDLCYHRLVLEEMKQKIRASFPTGSKFGVAEFKDLFALTRKHAIPLLEFLDRERFTRRQGNDRILL